MFTFWAHSHLSLLLQKKDLADTPSIFKVHRFYEDFTEIFDVCKFFAVSMQYLCEYNLDFADLMWHGFTIIIFVLDQKLCNPFELPATFIMPWKNIEKWTTTVLCWIICKKKKKYRKKVICTKCLQTSGQKRISRKLWKKNIMIWPSEHLTVCETFFSLHEQINSNFYDIE